MKKNIMLVVLVVLLVFTIWLSMYGKEIIFSGDYAEGTYFGYDEVNQVSAVVYVNDFGYIESVVLDKLQTINCVVLEDSEGEEIPSCDVTTKRVLGVDDTTEPLPWINQADTFATEVVKNQGITWVEFRYLNSNGDIVETKPEGQTESEMIYIDSLDEVSVPVDGMYNAILSALEKADK